MRKLLILFALFNCIVCTAFSQNSTVDSLRQLLATEKEDTGRVQLMYRLGRSFLYSKPDTTLFFAGQALELSKKIDFKKGEIDALSLTGSVLMTRGNYPRALEMFLQALKISEQIKDDSRIGRAVGSLSDVYFYLGDIKRSIDYSHQALSIHQKLRDTVRTATVLTNIGDTYEKSNQLDSALVYTRLAYQLSLSQKMLANQSFALSNLGNVLRKLGKIDTAMACYRSAISLFKQLDNDAALGETYLGMAKIFLQEKRADSGLYYAKLSFNISSSGGYNESVLAAANFLAEYYKSVGNVDSAYVYQSATIAAKDSLFSQQKANQVQGMTYDESMRRQQIEEAKEQERIRLKQNALIGGLIALLIVAFLLIRNNRQKRKANTLLQKQKEEIDVKANELSLQKENLQRSYDNVERLGEIGRKITASLSVEKIIGTVYDNVNSLMDAAVFGIGLYNDELKRIEFPATYENGEALSFYSNSIDDKNRLATVCFGSGKEIIIGNLDKEYKAYIPEVSTPHEGDQPVSVIFLPLIVKGKKLGVITVQSFKENAYSDYHLFMLRNIATYTAIAIENAESFEELQDTVKRLQSTQAQLIHAEKMASLGELTAGIAHEIQNPLNFVNNFSEVNNELIEEMNEQDNIDDMKIVATDIKRNNDRISFHGKRADAIVKNMLQHSRQTKGAKEPTDINALCDEYVRLAYHGLRAKDKTFNAKFETEFDQSLEKINIIPQDIGRVMLNLVNNAFYAVNERQKAEGKQFEPMVKVSTIKNNGTVEIKVEDNGSGISEKVVDKIFQPFFTTKPTGQGTGLGLSLVYDIVKAHGGEIKVQTVQGEGTDFVIQLHS